MKMPLSTEVDLGPGHIVLDGDPASPRNGQIGLLTKLANVIANIDMVTFC